MTDVLLVGVATCHANQNFDFSKIGADDSLRLGPKPPPVLQTYSLKMGRQADRAVRAGAEASKIISFLPNRISEPRVRNRLKNE